MTSLPCPLFPEAFSNWLGSAASGDLVFDSVHAEAVSYWQSCQYFEAHECWEELWRGQGPDTALRRALQGLIRLAAAGVKGKIDHLAGYQHHLRGALGHLTMARTLGIERSWPGPNWEEIILWVEASLIVVPSTKG